MPLPDADALMRGWLRGRSPIFALVNVRTYFAMPTSDTPSLPFTVHYQVSGRPDDKGQHYPSFIVECWGANKFESTNVARTVGDEIMAALSEAPTVIDNFAIISCGINSGPLYVGGTSSAKMSRIDASFMMRPA